MWGSSTLATLCIIYVKKQRLSEFQSICGNFLKRKDKKYDWGGKETVKKHNNSYT